MATHSSVLAWRIPGMGEPGGLLSMGSHRVGHDWSDLAAVAANVNKFSQVYWRWGWGAGERHRYTVFCFSGKYGFLPLNIQPAFCLIGSLSFRSEEWKRHKLREGKGGNTVGGAEGEGMGTGELDVGIKKQFQSAELKSQSRRVTDKKFRQVWSGVCRQ